MHNAIFSAAANCDAHNIQRTLHQLPIPNRVLASAIFSCTPISHIIGPYLLPAPDNISSHTLDWLYEVLPGVFLAIPDERLQVEANTLGNGSPTVLPTPLTPTLSRTPTPTSLHSRTTVADDDESEYEYTERDEYNYNSENINYNTNGKEKTNESSYPEPKAKAGTWIARKPSQETLTSQKNETASRTESMGSELDSERVAIS